MAKPLLGELTGLWAARRSRYRVVYAIHDDIVTVTIVRVAHRRGGYR